MLKTRIQRRGLKSSSQIGVGGKGGITAESPLLRVNYSTPAGGFRLKRFTRSCAPKGTHGKGVF